MTKQTTRTTQQPAAAQPDADLQAAIRWIADLAHESSRQIEALAEPAQAALQSGDRVLTTYHTLTVIAKIAAEYADLIDREAAAAGGHRSGRRLPGSRGAASRWPVARRRASAGGGGGTRASRLTASMNMNEPPAGGLFVDL